MASLAPDLPRICKLPFRKPCFVRPNPRALVNFFSSAGEDGGSEDSFDKSGPGFVSEFTPSSLPPPESPPSPPPQSPPSTSRFASYFSEVKSSLSQQQRLQQQGTSQTFTRKPSFSFRAPQENVNSLDEIRKKLSDFKARATAPPATHPAASPMPTELYKGHGTDETGLGPERKGSGLALIRESLRELGSAGMEKGRRVADPMALTAFRNSLRLGPRDRDPSPAFTRTGSFSEQMSGNESKGKKETGQSPELVRVYNYHDLGEKLKNLRPPIAEGENWFSFSELNERLVKLRSDELHAANKNILGVPIRDLRESLMKLRSDRDMRKREVLNRFGKMGRMQETPAPLPPKDHLLERFIHPDNLSTHSKVMLEVRKAAHEFRISESDCGSCEVRVARLTVKIKNFEPLVHKRNKSGRRYLRSLIERRKRYLIYLRREKFESYCYLIQKLGLDDLPPPLGRKPR